jgi:hypothetical protein
MAVALVTMQKEQTSEILATAAGWVGAQEKISKKGQRSNLGDPVIRYGTKPSRLSQSSRLSQGNEKNMTFLSLSKESFQE